MAFGPSTILLVAACFITWTDAIRPSTIDIKGLELLYRVGLQKTKELIRLEKYPIESIISNGKYNITQQIKESQERVSLSPGAGSECAKIHSSSLLQSVDSGVLNQCTYYQILNDALNKWNAVEAHIVFCSMSSTNACVKDIKEEIKVLEVTNADIIPTVSKMSLSCKNGYCDMAVRVIAKIDQEFFTCIQ